MTTPVIAIIGTGNMGSSLIGGLVQHGHPGSKLIAFDHEQPKLSHAKEQFGIHTAANPAKAAAQADVLIIAVKPQSFPELAKDLKTAVQKRKPLVISVAAGIRETDIQEWLGGQTAIVRSMPNTPAMIRCGATALYANHYVTPAQHDQAQAIMQAVGLVVWLQDEALMDTVTAVSGSGPAYFFLVMEAMQDAAEQLGLPPETARDLTLQTALGAARMAQESGKALAELRRSVTSPGGTTEKAIYVLEEHNIREIFRKAVQSAKIRSEELAKGIHK